MLLRLSVCSQNIIVPFVMDGWMYVLPDRITPLDLGKNDNIYKRLAIIKAFLHDPRDSAELGTFSRIRRDAQDPGVANLVCDDRQLTLN